MRTHAAKYTGLLWQKLVQDSYADNKDPKRVCHFSPAKVKGVPKH